jgi:hypothetical protein
LITLTDYDWRSGNSLVSSNKRDKYGIETKEKPRTEKREQRAPGDTNFTLNAADNTAGTWTTGSRRNGNSKVGRFGLSRPIRESATLADKEENHVFRLDRYK